MRRHTLVILTAAALLLPAVSRGQEVGAGRVEVGTAIFGGGMLFMPQPAQGESPSRSYAASAALTWNFSPRFGVEGDLGLAVGRHETMEVYGLLVKQRTPNVLMYSGDLVFNPLSRNRRLIPYVNAGVGAWSVLGGSDPASPLVAHTTYAAFNAGGGVRWIPVPHWGARADYRYVALRDTATSVTASYLGAHRVYAALMITF
jgi:opacity protein-like surface antigen